MADSGSGFFGGLAGGFSDAQENQIKAQREQASTQQQQQQQAQKQFDATVQEIKRQSSEMAAAGIPQAKILQQVQPLIASASHIAPLGGIDPNRALAMAQSAAVSTPPPKEPDEWKHVAIETGDGLGKKSVLMNKRGDIRQIPDSVINGQPVGAPNPSDTLSSGQIATANGPPRTSVLSPTDSALTPAQPTQRVAQAFADSSGAPAGATPAQTTQAPTQVAPAKPMTIDDAIKNNVTGDDFLKVLPPKLQNLVKDIAEYRTNPNSLSTRGGHREQILGLASQYSGHTYDQKFYPSMAQSIKEFTSGGISSPAGQITAGNTAIQHLGTVVDAYQGINKIPGLLQKIVDSGTPIASYAAKELQNRSIRGTSEGHALAAFLDARERYAAEIERFYSGTQGADKAKERSLATLDAGYSPPEFHSAVSSEAELLNGKINSLQDRWKTALSGPKLFDAAARKAVPDFPIVQEKSKATLERIRKLTEAKAASPSGNVTKSGVQWSIQP